MCRVRVLSCLKLRVWTSTGRLSYNIRNLSPLKMPGGCNLSRLELASAATTWVLGPAHRAETRACHRTRMYNSDGFLSLGHIHYAHPMNTTQSTLDGDKSAYITSRCPSNCIVPHNLGETAVDIQARNRLQLCFQSPAHLMSNCTLDTVQIHVRLFHFRTPLPRH